MRNLILCLSVLLFTACGSGDKEGGTDKGNDAAQVDSTAGKAGEDQVIREMPDDNKGMTQAEWDHLLSGVGDMSTVQGIDSYVQTVNGAQDKFRIELKDYGGEVEHHFEGYYVDNTLIFGRMDWALEPASSYKAFYYNDGELVYVTEQGHTMTGEGKETFTYFNREVYLDHGTLLGTAERSTKGEFTMERGFDFSPFEPVEFEPSEDMLSDISFLDGLKGVGEWANVE